MLLPGRSTLEILTAEARYTDRIHRLEERRKAKGAAYYERKKVAARQLSDAKKNATVKAGTAKALAAYGY